MIRLKTKGEGDEFPILFPESVLHRRKMIPGNGVIAVEPCCNQVWRGHETRFHNFTSNDLVRGGAIYVDSLHQRLEGRNFFLEPSWTSDIKEYEPLEVRTLLPGDRGEAVLFEERQPRGQPVSLQTLRGGRIINSGIESCK